MRGGIVIAVLAMPAWAAEPVRFTDVTVAAGIGWKHDNAATARKYIIETMGSGGAWLDYDGDDLLDLFLVNGGATPAYNPQRRPSHSLYRNAGNGSFVEVTSRAGLSGNGSFGMGAAAADFDNDGRTDLFVTGYPRSALYRNAGNGRFEEVTEKAGLSHGGRFASSAGWFDYDQDGLLDLLVLNYLDWSYETDVYCGDKQRDMRQYCHPDNYKGVSPALYRNRGGGKFEDATAAAGLSNPNTKGLGLVLADFNDDGRTDLFIANDGIANSFYWNRGGRFEDASLASGVAFSEDGTAEAGMGADAADYMRLGWLGIYVTHLEFQRNRLYRYLGRRQFADATVSAGLAKGRNLFSGFGARFIDYDNDGWFDIAVANGHILDNIQKVHPDVEYAEPKLMLRNLGGGKFEDVSRSLGPAFNTKTVGRALIAGDYDNDGDWDLAVTNNGQTPQLLRNDGGNARNWLKLKLIGTRSNRDAIGARVTVISGAIKQTDQIKGGGSYLCTGDPRLHFGLGSESMAEEVSIRWPSGLTDTLKAVPAGRILTVAEGSSARP